MKKTLDKMDLGCRFDISVVIDIVSEAYGLSPDIVTSRSRTTAPLKAKYSCYGFMISLKKEYSLADIGAAFGRDHASVLHGVNEHLKLYETDKHYRQKFDQISIKAKKALSGKSNNQVHDLVQRIDRTIESLQDIKKMVLDYFFDGVEVPNTVKTIIDESFPEHDEKRTIEKTIADRIQIG